MFRLSQTAVFKRDMVPPSTLSFSKEEFTGGRLNPRNGLLSCFTRQVQEVRRRVPYIAHFQSAVPWITRWPLVSRPGTEHCPNGRLGTEIPLSTSTGAAACTNLLRNAKQWQCLWARRLAAEAWKERKPLNGTCDD